ncbi:unnamed protein product, partial [Bubo scandiacus]
DDHQRQHQRHPMPLPLAANCSAGLQMSLVARTPGHSLLGLWDCTGLHGQKGNHLASL